MDIKEISKEIGELTRKNGFWPKNQNIPEKLMLIVSELGEAMESLRKDKYAKKHDFDDSEFWINETYSNAIHSNVRDKLLQEHFEEKIKDTFEDEIADTCIRLFDLADNLRIDLEYHIQKKHEYNKSRPYLHGKKF